VLKVINNREEWDNLVRNNGGHPLQLWGWGELKSRENIWSATRITIFDNKEKFLGGAQILARKLPKPFTKMLYVPRGPFANENNMEKVLREMASWAKRQSAVELKIEPDWTKDKIFYVKGFRKSREHILLPRTVRLDLSVAEENLLNQMSKKTRQYIRKSENDGVKIRRISSEKDIKTALAIYRETAVRDGFPLHNDEYYLDLAKFGGDANQIWLAEKDNQPLAFLWNFATPAVCFELYGGVNETGQQLRANFALKWQAIKFSRENGSRIYDLNGLLNDGVSNFKLGFGEASELIGTYDFPLSSFYSAYEKLLPLGKKILHKFKEVK